jgi:hypothetical protein
MAVSQVNVPRPSRQRSALTNSPYLLPGIDGRSAAGRRFRDLVSGVIAEFGGSNPEAVRELAGLRFTREQCQAAVITGDTRAREDLVRLGRLIVRLETTLRQANAAHMARAKVSPLARHFATPLRGAE